jgi:NADH-quinone oxidoreductase subunit A
VSGDYGYVLIFVLAGAVIVAGALGGAAFCAPFVPGVRNSSPYECGVAPRGTARVRYNFRYYLFAMFFVIFDVEAAFLLPWAVAYRGLLAGSGAIAFISVLIFLAVLAVPLAVAWKKGDLEWE